MHNWFKIRKAEIAKEKKAKEIKCPSKPSVK